MVPEIMCPSPSMASELQVAMSEIHILWRAYDLFQRHEICNPLRSGFPIEHMQIAVCTYILHWSLRRCDNHSVPRTVVSRRVGVFMTTSHVAVLSSQKIALSTPQMAHQML